MVNEGDIRTALFDLLNKPDRLEVEELPPAEEGAPRKLTVYRSDRPGPS